MDNTSIITQVTRDDEPLNYAHSSNEKNTPLKLPPKKCRKSFLTSLLCCFSQRSSCQNNSSRHLSTNSSLDHKPPVTVPNGNTVNGNSNITDDTKKFLLDPLRSNKKCIVIDLDETLVHSSFKPVNNADFIVPVEIEGTVHQVYVLKRPHVDTYLKRMGELFECVLFTASLSKYADPVADLLDKWGVFKTRLFRESCVFYRGNYVKDLSRLGRNLEHVVIVDNSPASYFFHPNNAVPVTSWFDDADDTELLDLIPFFEELASTSNVYSLLKSTNANDATQANLMTSVNQAGDGIIASVVQRAVVNASCSDYDNTYCSQ